MESTMKTRLNILRKNNLAKLVLASAYLASFAGQASACAWYDPRCWYEKASEVVVDPMIQKSREAVNVTAGIAARAARGDLVGVADDLINNAALAGGNLVAVHDQMFKSVTALAPAEITGFTDKAIDLRSKFEKTAYENLANTMRGDVADLHRILKGDRDAIEKYAKMTLVHAALTTDWRNPDSIRESAKRLAKGQYDAYRLLSAHTVKGVATTAALSAAEAEALNQAGMTEEQVAEMAKKVASALKEHYWPGDAAKLVLVELVHTAQQHSAKLVWLGTGGADVVSGGRDLKPDGSRDAHLELVLKDSSNGDIKSIDEIYLKINDGGGWGVWSMRDPSNWIVAVFSGPLAHAPRMLDARGLPVEAEKHPTARGKQPFFGGSISSGILELYAADNMEFYEGQDVTVEVRGRSSTNPNPRILLKRTITLTAENSNRKGCYCSQGNVGPDCAQGVLNQVVPRTAGQASVSVYGWKRREVGSCDRQCSSYWCIGSQGNNSRCNGNMLRPLDNNTLAPLMRQCGRQ